MPFAWRTAQNHANPSSNDFTLFRPTPNLRDRLDFLPDRRIPVDAGTAANEPCQHFQNTAPPLDPFPRSAFPRCELAALILLLLQRCLRLSFSRGGSPIPRLIAGDDFQVRPTETHQETRRAPPYLTSGGSSTLSRASPGQSCGAVE